jgi:putative tricarboxylic transport membrane protein
MLHLFFNGLMNALSFKGLLYVTIGVVWGIFGGAMPGISGSVAMALLLPLTFGLEPIYALPMLCAVYVGAEYGGSIPAILIKTPGTGANAATVIDGYELHRQGRGGEALFSSLLSGTIVGIVSVILLVIFAVPLASFGLKFGPSQYTLLGILGLCIIGSISGNNQLKGMLSAVLGLWLAVVGADPISAEPRYTFGYYKLISGINLIPLIVGMFAISEVFRQATEGEVGSRLKEKVNVKFPKLKKLLELTPIAVVSGVIGTFVGALPGAGGSIASWLCYSQAKQWCKNTETFGQGDLRGVAAPEAGNNSVPAGSLIPLLALGVPGSNSAAVLMASFSIFGIGPGPMLFVERPEVPYTIMACMLIAQFVMFFVGLIIIKPAVIITSIDKSLLCTAILIFASIGAFSVSNDPFAILLAVIFGIVGFFMKKYDYSPAATVLGFVLGEIIEGNFRRSLSISRGSFDIFFTGGLNMMLMFMIVASLLFPVVSGRLAKRRAAAAKNS